jgi:HSP90 family molecular chaperone
MSLTDPEALKSQSDLKLTIFADRASKTLTITDTGVGMTRDQLISNLGIIAKSGTSEFLKESENGTDMGLIGQFGVGYVAVVDAVLVSTLCFLSRIPSLLSVNTMTTSSISGSLPLKPV